MRFFHVEVIVLAAGTASFGNAHTAFTNFFVDGVDQGDGTAVRMSNNIPEATYPLPNITTGDMACGTYLSTIALAGTSFNTKLHPEPMLRSKILLALFTKTALIMFFNRCKR